MFDTAYISKCLDFCPDDLAHVVSQWHRGLLPVRWTSRALRVSEGFWISPDPVVPCADGLTVYRVSGVVWTAGRPISVSLDFVQWSRTRSEVGVSPRSLAWPVGTDRYYRCVGAALDEIGRSLCGSTGSADEPIEVPASAEPSEPGVAVPEAEPRPPAVVEVSTTR